MSRRNTILVAVLINSGLLVILFATAMTGDKERSLALASQSQINPQPIVALNSSTEEVTEHFAMGEEVEQVLSHYHDQAIASAEALPASTPAVINPFPEMAIAVPASAVVEEVAPRLANSVEVTVKKGDSLDKIARDHGSSIEGIVEANQLLTTQLQIGQVLQVPIKKIAGVKARALEPKEGGSDPRFYTVRSGDNPWLIANKFNIPLDQLLKLNGLDEARARKLKPGDKIRIQ